MFINITYYNIFICIKTYFLLNNIMIVKVTVVNSRVNFGT